MHVGVECSSDLNFCELPEIEATGRLQVVMAQYLFDVSDGASALKERRCGRMPQNVRCNSFAGALEQRIACTSEPSLSA